MKAGPEAHFLSGQVFMLGIAAVAVLPRMPSDTEQWTIGGRLSFPFRRALLFLIGISLARLFCFHVVIALDDSTRGILVAMDAALETVHVIGQTFLCLTTAYLLQRQLSNYINIEGGAPGRNLVPFLIVISCLTAVGSLGSNLFGAVGWNCWTNLAEAISCYPVLKTLRLYTTVTTTTTSSSPRGWLRGPVLVQMLIVAECWYLTTSLLSVAAQAMAVNPTQQGEMDAAEGHFLQLLSIAVRQNQDNGVDDWTRLLLHAVFLNGLDELHHVFIPGGGGDQQQQPSRASTGGETSDSISEDMPPGELMPQPLIHRSRVERGFIGQP